MDRLPVIINLCGAPGAGKSTGASYIFSQLKMAGVNAELITEFAKDKTWEHNSTALANQIYIMSKQYYKITRCKEQVDVIVTDSPLILSLLYGEGLPYEKELDELVLKLWKLDNNILYFVNRNKPYNPAGRNQTAEESDALSVKLKYILKKNNIKFEEIFGDINSYDAVVNQILSLIKSYGWEEVWIVNFFPFTIILRLEK